MLDRLVIGSAQFGYAYGLTNISGKVKETEIQKIISFARSVNINTIDTAIAYGDSEDVIGKVVTPPWKVITKLPPAPKHCSNIPDWVRGQIEASLSRLKCNRPYALLLHHPDDLISKIGTILYKSLQDIKSEGVISKIGISVHNTMQIENIVKYFDIDIIQCPFNIIDRSLIETGWANRLSNAGVEIHARSVFLQGLLLLAPELRPSKFLGWNEVWTEWDRWLSETGVSPLEACIRYVYNCPGIDKIVVGSESTAQLRAVVAAVGGNLPNLPIFPPLIDDRLVNPARWNEL